MKRLLLLLLLLAISNLLNAQGWGQTQKIVPEDRFQAQQFGADVSMDGNYAIVGVLVNNFADTAYIYEHDGNGNWVQLQKLESPEPNQFDHFGVEVAIDGDYIFVGAIGEDYDDVGANFIQGAGAVYIFKKQETGLFEFEQKIVASDREFINEFGRDIDVSGDYAIIGVQRQDYDVDGNNFLDDAGAAYIFEKDALGVWNEVQKIVALDRGAFDYFGEAVAIDGSYAVVGAYVEDEDENGVNTLEFSGSAYIYERNDIGDWDQVQKIVPSNRQGSELFGRDVAVNGNYIAVGAEQGNVNGGFAGSVYMFERDGTGTWNETQEIVVSSATSTDRFGQSVSLNGNHILAGAYTKDIGSTGDGGAAFMFENDGTGVWNQVAVMYDPDVSSFDYFGYDVAVSGDYAMVGAYQDEEDENEENTLQEAGASFIFNVNEPNTLPPLNTLSIVESDFKNIVKGHPNPTQEELSLDLKTVYETIEISVVNMLGQEMLEQTFRSKAQIDLNLKNLEKGLYLVNLKLNQSKKHVLKIIKD